MPYWRPEVERDVLLGDFAHPVGVLRVRHALARALHGERPRLPRAWLDLPDPLRELRVGPKPRQDLAAVGVEVEPLAQRRLAARDHHLLHRQLLAHDELVDERGRRHVDVEEAAEGRQVVLERGQVIDRLHALERLLQGRLVAHVPAHEINAGIEVARHLAAAVDGLLQAVEHADLVALREQRVGGVRSDEACAACDENFHDSIPALSSLGRVRLERVTIADEDDAAAAAIDLKRISRGRPSASRIVLAIGLASRAAGSRRRPRREACRPWHPRARPASYHSSICPEVMPKPRERLSNQPSWSRRANSSRSPLPLSVVRMVCAMSCISRSTEKRSFVPSLCALRIESASRCFAV